MLIKLLPKFTFIGKGAGVDVQYSMPSFFLRMMPMGGIFGWQPASRQDPIGRLCGIAQEQTAIHSGLCATGVHGIYTM